MSFLRRKYGGALLVDAGWTSAWPHFFQRHRPHQLGFYDLLLVTEGAGTLWHGGRQHDVQAGQLIVTRPGDTRRWVDGWINGACVFFTEDLFPTTFAEPERIGWRACFGEAQWQPVMRLDPAGHAEFLGRFLSMRAELELLRADSRDRLLAVLLDLLIVISRQYPAIDPAGGTIHSDVLVDRMLDLAVSEARGVARVSDIAQALGMTPAALSRHCRQANGRSAGALVREAIAEHAVARLRASSEPVVDIAASMGFDDAAYFSRFIRRETGLPPSAHRRAATTATRRHGFGANAAKNPPDAYTPPRTRITT